MAAPPDAPSAPGAPGAFAHAQGPRAFATSPPVRAQRLANPGRALVSTPMAGRLKGAARVCGSSFETVASLFESAREARPLSYDDARRTMESLVENLDEDRDALLSMVRLKSHDDYACMHSVAVCVLMTCLARQLGFDKAREREAAMAGLMHDIGKAFVSRGLLQKPDRFTAEEHRLVQCHTVFGHQALAGMDEIAEAVRDVALHHHERPDGAGYPDGLAGEQISLYARMGAICDVYDAITSNRPYKDGWDPGLAMERMIKWTRAGQFDPQVMAVFQALMGRYPIGSLVRLRSRRLAVINAQNSGKLLQPCVTVFYDIDREELMVPEVIDLGLPGAQELIEAAESNANWRFTDLDTLWAGDLAGGIHHAGYLPATLPGGIRC